ncbi:Fc.00g017290.m01.CDS01 [Cosmosporella sp. VM-42]
MEITTARAAVNPQEVALDVGTTPMNLVLGKLNLNQRTSRKLTSFRPLDSAENPSILEPPSHSVPQDPRPFQTIVTYA